MADTEGRDLVSRFYGKSVSEEEWQWMQPLPGDGPGGEVEDEPFSLNKSIRDLPPRMHEQGWELAAMIGVSQAVAGVARSHFVAVNSELARGDLFGRGGMRAGYSGPPFRSRDEARRWIQREYEEGLVACSDSEREFYQQFQLDEEDNPNVAISSSAAPSLVWLPAYRTGDEPLGEKQRAVAGVPGDLFTLPGEEWWCTTSPGLKCLAYHAAWIARISKCWSLGQSSSFILADEVPNLPRFRVWTTRLPGGGRRSVIELFGSISFREMQELYRIMREQAQLKGRKSLTPEDVEILDFVAITPTPAWTWDRRVQRWNKEHEDPGRQYASSSAFWKAHDRANGRKGRP